jgi:catechol 2,3-dioxygenase-like lactoylglutathione lyase family enzyme
MPGRPGITTGVSVQLDHTIVACRDQQLSAAFLSRILGWADPGRTQRGAINHHDGGRGLYFEDPDGHLLEIITRPYGSGG